MINNRRSIIYVCLIKRIKCVIVYFLHIITVPSSHSLAAIGDSLVHHMQRTQSVAGEENVILQGEQRGGSIKRFKGGVQRRL